MPNPSRLLIILFILTLAVHSLAKDAIIGKVISVSDGDTITVLENRTQYKIRLYGIDSPDSNRAKKFVFDLVFGKQVRVVQMDIDRYKRVVGMVYVGDVNVNEALVKNGLAWVYQRYCKISTCSSWLALEALGQGGKDRIVVAPYSSGAVGVSQKSANIPAAGLGSKTGRDRLSWQSQLKGLPSSIL